jgi:acyl transferase domain-containing protein
MKNKADGTFSSLSPLQQALLTIDRLQKRLIATGRSGDDRIAVIGMGCRFPGGANSPAQFRELLWAGREVLTEIPPERRSLHGFYDPEIGKPGKMYLKRAGFLDSVDAFDADFFRIPRREAETMDPQQRMFLEVSWEALEDASIVPHSLMGTRTAVFAGVHTKDYSYQTGCPPDQIGPLFSPGVDASFVAGRLSYFLGLQGPSMAVDTACSSSLVAIHLACQSLRTEESTLAIAGGVKLMLTPHLSIFLCSAGALSQSGYCRAFDQAADGMVQGEGCGVVILKRLRDALRDGDRILATIRGSATNHNGKSAGLTAPSPAAQEAVYRHAVQRAGIDPTLLDYVEAHGTGTKLGDPIELESLARVYGAGRPPSRPLYIGSVKTNIGHTESAAGAAGLIKAVLALNAKEIPPSLHFQHPTADFDWSSATIAVTKELTPLARRDEPLLAGVSSFGMSGVNAHVILESAPS